MDKKRPWPFLITEHEKKGWRVNISFIDHDHLTMVEFSNSATLFEIGRKNKYFDI